MSEAGKLVSRILIVRMGAMGDIIHIALPPRVLLRASFPNARINGVVELAPDAAARRQSFSRSRRRVPP